jgi:hypothetical protein
MKTDAGNSAYVPPPFMTAEELRLKLTHLSTVLSKGGYDAVLLNSEGALRWLTGIKHQLIEIAPIAVSPVQAMVRICSGGGFQITFVSKPYELPRLRDEIPVVFQAVPEVQVSFSQTVPVCCGALLTSEKDEYAAVLDRIVRPVLGGLTGNSFSKVSWLSKTSMQALGSTARQLKCGMRGLEVRGLLLHELARRGVDANLVLIALSGQEKHLHPVASDCYKVEPGRWMKLVAGARYAEHIVSQTLMVNCGGTVTAKEQSVYCALQQAALEYADLYRQGAVEFRMHSEMQERFKLVGERAGLAGFAGSAVLHHPGGGTSPLGNRDRMIDPSGNRTFDAWTQFAINPVDALLGMKVELQGLVMPDVAAPMIFDMGLADAGVPFRTVTASGGTSAVLPDLMVI